METISAKSKSINSKALVRDIGQNKIVIKCMIMIFYKVLIKHQDPNLFGYQRKVNEFVDSG